MEFAVEQVYYLRNKKGHRIGCVAMGFNYRENVEIDIAASLVSKNDIFCRRSARSIALSRLRSDSKKTRRIFGFDDDILLSDMKEILRGLKLDTISKHPDMDNRYNEIDFDRATSVKNDCIEYAIKELRAVAV